MNFFKELPERLCIFSAVRITGGRFILGELLYVVKNALNCVCNVNNVCHMYAVNF